MQLRSGADKVLPVHAQRAMKAYRTKPMPLGVPVSITVPGSSVVSCEQNQQSAS
jgi:hypothetical protein